MCCQVNQLGGKCGVKSQPAGRKMWCQVNQLGGKSGVKSQPAGREMWCQVNKLGGKSGVKSQPAGREMWCQVNQLGGKCGVKSQPAEREMWCHVNQLGGKCGVKSQPAEGEMWCHVNQQTYTMVLGTETYTIVQPGREIWCQVPSINIQAKASAGEEQAPPQAKPLSSVLKFGHYCLARRSSVTNARIHKHFTA